MVINLEKKYHKFLITCFEWFIFWAFIKHLEILYLLLTLFSKLTHEYHFGKLIQEAVVQHLDGLHLSLFSHPCATRWLMPTGLSPTLQNPSSHWHFKICFLVFRSVLIYIWFFMVIFEVHFSFLTSPFSLSKMDHVNQYSWIRY